MTGKVARISLAFAGLVILFLVVNFGFPFGLIPKFASPNCGPEHRRWLDKSFAKKSDIVDYLHNHELELLSGTNTPRLGEIPEGVQVSRMDIEMDWQAIYSDIQIKHRLGYDIYTLVYHHPACSKTQSYTLKITSFGYASLYGCCGV